MESVVAAHEIIHDAVVHKTPGFIFKLDYEKAYDRVSHEFLFKMLAHRGFSPKWVRLIQSLLDRASVGVRINNVNSHFFIATKGVGQGDPVSPLLFNLVADVFTRMLTRAAQHSHIRGLMTRLYPNGVISLQYADDTLIFIDDKLETAQNLKWFMSCFEQLSGLRINFHKCDLIPLNVPDCISGPVSQALGCRLGELPMKYLGVPLHHSKLRRGDLQPVVDKTLSRGAGWRGRLLSPAKRLVLVKVCMASIPTYLFSFIRFPKWAISLMNSQLAHCFWDSYDGHFKYHLANIELLTMKKEFGGLGIPNLADMNLCLLASWVKRHEQGNGKIWKQIVDFKYKNYAPNIFACPTLHASPF